MAKAKPHMRQMALTIHPADEPHLGPNSGHITVEISSVFAIDHLGPQQDHADMLNAWRWCASVLARLGMALGNALAIERQDHGNCRHHPYAPACGAYGADLDPQQQVGPVLSIALRADCAPEYLDAWLERITTTLTRLTKETQ